MESLRDIKRERDNQEYEILLPVREDSIDQTPLIARGKKWTVQQLVQKFSTSLQIRLLGDEIWKPAYDFGFRVQRIKNVAVAEARLRNTFRRKKIDKTPDMFDYDIEGI